MSEILSGILIEESLEDKEILQNIKIIKTEVELVVEAHKTPWIKTWTLHTFEVEESNSDLLAKQISESIDRRHASSWYVDFKNQNTHYIIFRDKVFKVDRFNPDQYLDVVAYGVLLGIPEYQLDFSPHNQDWSR